MTSSTICSLRSPFLKVNFVEIRKIAHAARNFLYYKKSGYRKTVTRMKNLLFPYVGIIQIRLRVKTKTRLLSACFKQAPLI